jgi:hypothetical protein
MQRSIPNGFPNTRLLFDKILIFDEFQKYYSLVSAMVGMGYPFSNKTSFNKI